MSTDTTWDTDECERHIDNVWALYTDIQGRATWATHDEMVEYLQEAVDWSVLNSDIDTDEVDFDYLAGLYLASQYLEQVEDESYHVLTCDECGRIGNEDDGIEIGGPCQEPCEGTVREVTNEWETTHYSNDDLSEARLVTVGIAGWMILENEDGHRFPGHVKAWKPIED